MKAIDHLHMPELLSNEYPVQLSDTEQETYKQFKSELILEMQDTEITAANAAALSNKLSQLANGAVYDDTGAVIPIHSRKLDALEDLIEATNGKPVLVAYWFKHDRTRIAERLQRLRVSYQEIQSSDSIRNWNARRLQVGLLHPAAAGHGLNLQQHLITKCTIDELILKALTQKEQTQTALMTAVRAEIVREENA